MSYFPQIIPALQSRCTRFRFAPLSKECVLSRLKDIMQQEKCAVLRSPLPPNHL